MGGWGGRGPLLEPCPCQRKSGRATDRMYLARPVAGHFRPLGMYLREVGALIKQVSNRVSIER